MNIQTNKPNLLFYSKACNSCYTLITYLKQNQLENYFKYICVEDYINNPILNNVHAVPTIILPEFNKILVGKDIFIFLQNIVNNRQTMLKNNQTVNVQTQETNQKKILDFVPNEMNGFSDKYAYTFTDIPFSQKFVNYNDSNSSILTGEELAKISKNNQTKYIQQINNTRKQQDEEFNNYLVKQQSNQDKILEHRKAINNKIEEYALKRNAEIIKR